jgi:hypothetical protein
MIRCVPGGGVGDEPEANEEEEGVEVEGAGVLKWKAEGKSVIFLDSFGGFRGCSSIFPALGLSRWILVFDLLSFEMIGY